MPYGVERKSDRLEIQLGDDRVAVLHWFHNRLHFHPRVLRLSFVGFEQVPNRELDFVVDAAFSELLAVHKSDPPLLLRATLDQGSNVLPRLRRIGFLECRRVFVVSLLVDEVDLNPRVQEVGGDIEVVSLADARLRARDVVLENLFLEVYSRVSRLDPATPERLTAEERQGLFLGDTDLDRIISSVAFRGERPIGLCAAYQGERQAELELGATGVCSEELREHHWLTIAMLKRTLSRAKDAGARAVVAEVDSDDPWSLYVFADLPCHLNGQSMSLVYLPRWQVTPES